LARKERREHANRYAAANDAQDVLDFHQLGPLDGKTIKQMTQAFIESAHAKQLTCVRIVTGKGNRSKGDPLVGPQVRRTLNALAREGRVRAFQSERLDRGGDGAMRIEI
jgi:DNA-nicking Smr family endonuclease